MCDKCGIYLYWHYKYEEKIYTKAIEKLSFVVYNSLDTVNVVIKGKKNIV